MNELELIAPWHSQWELNISHAQKEYLLDAGEPDAIR